MSKAELRAFWASVPSFVKTVGALCTGFGSAVILVGAALDIPARVTATEVTAARHTIEIQTLQNRSDATDRRTEYLICLVEHQSGEGRRTPAQCAADYARGTP